ncbi:phytanoyl-CoA dioxygenase family protein [Salinactinospora qingdaonensis]|uniref:Phytanoyl-CoA dioxygenase family protein n=1 Tax=Salinactinospora qingdaonensis TaxID=702744 RepID=A0ABP7G5N4_9ACTN
MGRIVSDTSRVTSPSAFREHFTTNGFSVVEQLFDEELFSAMRARLDDILARRTDFPEEAFNTERHLSSDSTEPVVRKLKDVAHNDALFAEAARHERILDLVQEITGPDIKLHASIGWMKPPHIGSPKSPHQDAAYWTHIEPPEFVVCWIAIDPATPDNGCLNFVPGSHQRGIFPHAMLEEWRVPEEEVPYDQAVTVPVPAGGASFHSGKTVHWSGPNHSPYPRRALSFAYMSAQCVLTEQWQGKMRFDLVRGRSYEGCV